MKSLEVYRGLALGQGAALDRYVSHLPVSG